MDEYTTKRAWLALALALLVGCGPQEAAPPPPQPPAPQPQAEPTPAPAQAPDPFLAPNRVSTGKVQRGDTLHKMLQTTGLSREDRVALIEACKPGLDLARDLRPGDSYQVAISPEQRLVAFVYQSQQKGSWRLDAQVGQGGLALSRPDGAPLVVKEPEAAPKAEAEAAPAPEEPAPEEPALAPLEQEVKERLERERQEIEAQEKQRSRALNRIYTIQPPEKKPGNKVQQLMVDYYATSDEAQRASLAREIAGGTSLARIRQHLAQAYKPPRRKPGVYQRSVKTDFGSARYVVYVPKDYNGRKAMPLHISLHGGGGTGEGNCRVRWGPEPPKGFLLVCPSTPSGAWWTPRGEETVLEVYKAVMREFLVQADRVSLGGASNGGNGTWQLGAKYPWLWSALVPRCAVALAKDEWRQNMKHLPVFMLHGTEDHQIVVSHSREMLKYLRALGAKPRYIEVKGAGHNFFTERNPEVIRWMLPKQRRLPRSFVYHDPRGREPDLIYWLSARGAGDIEASIQLEGGVNQVRLKTEKDPTLLKIYFARGLADLRKPVRVWLNDQVVFDGRVRGDVRDVLDSFALTGDLRRVFDAAITVR